MGSLRLNFFVLLREKGNAFLHFLILIIFCQTFVMIDFYNHSFIHSFIMHSVNPYKVSQPIGYKTCQYKCIIINK
jgi:hypothetical protein